MLDEPTLSPPVSRAVSGAAAGLWNLGRLRRGHGDPTLRRHGEVWWRAASTPQGPVLVRLQPHGDDVTVSAWGEGTTWALDQVPRLLGQDDPCDFSTDDPMLAPLLRRHRLLIGATDLFAEIAAPAVIEQRVTGAEAFASFRRLVRRFGTPAPGPASLEGHPAHRMVCPPTAAQWAAIPSWEYLQAGVEGTRATALVRLLGRADAVERLLANRADQPEASSSRTEVGEALERAITSLPGIGPWTSAMVRQGVLGDPDAWSIDDYHVPGTVARALGGDDASQASALLERFRPHRYRVELLIARSGLGLAQRKGARRSLPTHLPIRRG